MHRIEWVSKDKLLVAGGKVTLADAPRCAQIIDGQHRVAGLKDAIKSDKTVSSVEIPVAIYENLDTRECADIFLSINTEQKPVSRTLVFDLYGVASEYLIDETALRAKDIATALNESDESPYRGWIKFPGSPRMKGGIALSTVVSALKPLVDNKGPLDNAKVRELERQTSVLINLFGALNDKYGDQWNSPDNPFLYASGFLGALQLFRNKIIDYCTSKKSFKKDLISSLINMPKSQRLKQSEVRGQSGSKAVSLIYDRLLEMYEPEDNSGDHEIEI
ncbi:DGQHR domain-containing protein [Terriglobus roseus]|uniref:DGQHR domain-containing protein n=1 Tax=Terriglobus roseus TaxID=392734 RepID=UPI001BAF3827|nr:DGQHR domain-containing protein [Terriglobus roseus]